MSVAYLASQVIVVVAYIILGIGLSKKERLQILASSSVYQSLMIIHFALLGGVTGIIASIIALFRNFLFIYNEKKKKENSPWFLVLFGAIAIVSTIVFYKSIADVLPCILTLVGIYSYWCRSTKVTRIGNLIISGCYIVYALYLHSWLSIACELYLVVTTIIGYIKYEKK